MFVRMTEFRPHVVRQAPRRNRHCDRYPVVHLACVSPIQRRGLEADENAGFRREMGHRFYLNAGSMASFSTVC